MTQIWRDFKLRVRANNFSLKIPKFHEILETTYFPVILNMFDPFLFLPFLPAITP